MLYEIICDNFKKQRIEFNPHLNTILGDDFGSNSIGKSTILMIVDFVFGGKDYIEKLRDVQRNVGYHSIKFCFKFNSKNYFFLRKTVKPEFVWICDKDYEPKEEISLDNFCLFLKEKYEIDINFISFRDIVGRYSRIYGKDNLNEKKPLDIVQNETSGAPINSLIKLFNKYSEIKDSEEELKEKKSEFKAYKDAQKYSYISSIGKREYKKNTKEIEVIQKNMNELVGDLNKGLLELDSIQTEEVLELKSKISLLKRKRSKLKSDANILVNNNVSKSKTNKNKFDGLIEYFPKMNLEKLNRIEEFHEVLTSNLKDELHRKKKENNKLIEIADNEIEALENSLSKIIKEPKISSIILKKYANMQKDLDRLKVENSSLDTFDDLKEKEKKARGKRIKLRSEVLLELEKDINTKLESINSYIYDNTKKPPIINFDDNKYNYQTIDDSGTGNNYKSLIIYDLSILEMTKLPILIHDSVVLKQIQDNAVEKILKKYLSENKQIFISLDKKNAYSKESQKILIENKVLELSPNGNELFGWSWSKTEE